MTVTDLRPVAERYLRNLAHDMGYVLQNYEVKNYLDDLGEINIARMHDVVEEIKLGLTFPSLTCFISRYRDLNE